MEGDSSDREEHETKDSPVCAIEGILEANILEQPSHKSWFGKSHG